MQEFFKLKNGQTVTIRPARPEDAEAAVEYMDELSRQTIYTTQYPGQPKKNLEKMRQAFQNKRGIDFVVLDGDKVMGMAMIDIKKPDNPWMKHMALFGVHMLLPMRDQGIGKRLLHLTDEWCLKNGISRIEGRVRTQNQAAIALYLKNGYIIEGVHTRCAFIDGVWHDEYSIAKISD